MKKKEKAHLTVFFCLLGKGRKRRKSCSFFLPYNSQKDKKRGNKQEKGHCCFPDVGKCDSLSQTATSSPTITYTTNYHRSSHINEASQMVRGALGAQGNTGGMCYDSHPSKMVCKFDFFGHFMLNCGNFSQISCVFHMFGCI